MRLSMLLFVRDSPRDDPGEADSIHSYLLPRERLIAIVRKHPGTLTRSVCLLLGNLAAIGAGIGIAVQANMAGIAPWPLPVLACLCGTFALLLRNLRKNVLAWRKSYFVITNSRIIVVNWEKDLPLSFVLLSFIEEIKFNRPLPARIIGYGSMIFETSEDGGTAYMINHIPYPEQIYLEVTGLLV